MSRLFLLAHAVTFGYGYPAARRAAARARPSWGYRAAYTLLAASLLFGFAYLFIVNDLATAGFAETARRTEVRRLQEEHAALQATYEQLRSWDSIVVRLQETDLVETKHVEYVRALPLPVAKK